MMVDGKEGNERWWEGERMERGKRRGEEKGRL